MPFAVRWYRGWSVHMASFLCVMIALGCTTNIFGQFVIPVTEEFGITRASANNAMIAFMLGTGLMSPVVGKLLDRYSARWIMFCGGLSFGAGMIGVAASSHPMLMLAIIVGPIAFGNSAAGTLAANTVVVRWFRQRRGKALGTLAISTSAGGFIFNQVAAFLIEGFGWRTTLVVIGIIAWSVISLVTLLIIRDRPSGNEPGYEREFAEAPTASAQSTMARTEERTWTFVTLVRDRNFWLMAMGIGLLFGSDQAIVSSQIPLFLDSGIDLKAAALIASCMTISAIGGKLIVGYLADKVDMRSIFLVIAVAHVCLLGLYIWMPTYWLLLVLAAAMGVGIGGVFPLWTTMIAWLYGSRSYGTIMGIMTLMMIKPLGMIALRFIGEVHDRTGTYDPAFTTLIGAVLLAMLLIWMIRKPDEAVPVAKKTSSSVRSGEASPAPT